MTPLRRRLGGLALALLTAGALAQSPGEKRLKLQVDPPGALLVLNGHTVVPRDGEYRLSSGFFRDEQPGVPRLTAAGYQDLSLPPVSRSSLSSYSPGPSFQLPVASLGALLTRHFLVLLGVSGAVLAGLAAMVASQRPPSSPARPSVPGPLAVEPESPPAAPQDPMIGRELGRYVVTGYLGSGGMATVYKALPRDDMVESEAVAIKVIRPDQASADFQKRFEREIRVSMKLNHPNVLRIIDWETSGGFTYLVMEYIDGVPLSQKIPAGGLGVQEAMRYLPSIVEALAYAHSLGIVHRDLKPENVMISHKGRVKLMDFGLARNQDVSTVTVQGVSVGTPQYMAPEQVLRGPGREGLTDSSDQYALAILMFEVLCGRRPFEFDEPLQLLMMHLTVEPPKVTSFRPDVPPAVEAVLDKMLQKQPEQRFPSVKEAGVALLRAAEGYLPDPQLALDSLSRIAPPRERPDSTEQLRTGAQPTRVMQSPSAGPEGP